MCPPDIELTSQKGASEPFSSEKPVINENLRVSLVGLLMISLLIYVGSAIYLLLLGRLTVKRAL